MPPPSQGNASRDSQAGAVLLIAQSARMLTASAHRAGLPAFALDLFGDEDTRQLAVAHITVPRLAEPELAAGLAALPSPPAGLIYGSGIDTQPRLLERLRKGRLLLGNTPKTLRLMRSPKRFFRLLDHLAIPHPETRFSRPLRPAGWLHKLGCSEGGKGVGFCAEKCRQKGLYYQKWMPGDSVSALFLADGRDVRIVGFNAQWSSNHAAETPFLFAGAINRAPLDRCQRARTYDYAVALTRAAGLVGLNSLDFIHSGDDLSVLELNPRPSATMALYDEDFPDGLLQAHIHACQGRLPARDEWPGPARAFRIVYAPRALTIPDGVIWPDWSVDRPRAGTLIRRGEPICTAKAEAGLERAAIAAVNRRAADILTRLDSWPGAEAPRRDTSCISSPTDRG